MFQYFGLSVDSSIVYLAQKYLDSLTGSAEDICICILSRKKKTQVETGATTANLIIMAKIVWLAKETSARRINFQSPNTFKEFSE